MLNSAEHKIFILLINVKMPTIVGILTFISKINATYERLKARNFFICWYFSFLCAVEISLLVELNMKKVLSEPIFYGDSVYKFKRIVGKPNFSDQFKKIVKRYIRVGYNLDIMRQSACLVLNPNTVYSYGFLFNCMTVGQASDSMTALT